MGSRRRDPGDVIQEMRKCDDNHSRKKARIRYIVCGLNEKGNNLTTV